MFKVNSVTNDPLQKQIFNLADGTQVSVTIYYVSQQVGWFIRELSYNGIVIQGMRICNSLNILQQYKNKLPFGIACLTKGNREPLNIEDFSSGNSALYILSADEVHQYSGYLSGV